MFLGEPPPLFFHSPVASRFASLVTLQKDLETSSPTKRFERILNFHIGGPSKRLFLAHICAELSQESNGDFAVLLLKD